MLRRLGDLWVLFIQVEITGSLGVYLTQQAAKLQIENFGLPPFSFYLFLSSVHQWFFFLLATYIFLGLCSYVLLVITLSDDANISIIQKKGEERGETNWSGTGRATNGPLS